MKAADKEPGQMLHEAMHKALEWWWGRELPPGLGWQSICDQHKRKLAELETEMLMIIQVKEK